MCIIIDFTRKIDISDLKDKKIIRFVGSLKTGYYALDDPINDPINDPVNDPIKGN